MLKKLFNLQMFSEGAEDSSLAMNTADTESTTTIGLSAGANTDTPDASADDMSSPADTTDTESFETLIQGKYKDDYDKMVKARVKEAISKRFKNQDDFKAKYEGLTPLLSQIATKYGIDPNDHDALTNAIANDNSLYEQEAFEKGIDVETLKQMKTLERENARLKASEDARLRDEQGREAFNQLVQQGEQLKQIYPQFNLDDEMMNEAFGRLLANNVPMQTAYEVIHKDEILSSGMAYAVQKTAANISSSIASGARRPSENGMSSQATASAGQLDPTKLTLKDFAALRARAEKGEKIYFN